MGDLDGVRTLLLNSSYEPLRTLSWQRAMTLDFQDRVDVVEYYQIGVRTPSDRFPVPAVIRLRQYLRIGRRKVHMSRKNVFIRDSWTCQYCGCGGNTRTLTIDHVMPRSRGGGNTWDNVVAACGKCNHRKGAKTPREAGMPLRTDPEVPDLLEWHRRASPGGNAPAEWQAYLAG